MNESPLALVTGAARGIGAAIAVKLANLGMNVASDDKFNREITEDQRIESSGHEVGAMLGRRSIKRGSRRFASRGVD